MLRRNGPVHNPRISMKSVLKEEKSSWTGRFQADRKTKEVMDEENGKSTQEEVTGAWKGELERHRNWYEVVGEKQGVDAGDSMKHNIATEIQESFGPSDLLQDSCTAIYSYVQRVHAVQ